MAKITLKGSPVQTHGDIPKKGSKAADFTLVNQELEDKTLIHFQGKKKLLFTGPSLDTSVCAACAKELNEFAKTHSNYLVLIVTADLPFAQKRFCTQESLQNIVTLSMIRNKDFATDYGILMEDGPLAGLCARALLALSESDIVLYSELVEELGSEPNYKEAFAALEEESSY